MKKETGDSLKKEPVAKESNRPSFDWLLFMFLVFVIILLAIVFTK